MLGNTPLSSAAISDVAEPRVGLVAIVGEATTSFVGFRTGAQNIINLRGSYERVVYLTGRLGKSN